MMNGLSNFQICWDVVKEYRPGPGNEEGMDKLLRGEFWKRYLSPRKEEIMINKYVCLDLLFYKMGQRKGHTYPLSLSTSKD